MSKSRVKNVQQQDPPTSTGPQPASASNQEASENVESTGLQNYEQTLGSWLGPKLYEAVSDALTEEAFEGYTKDAIDALFETLAEQADKLDGTANTSQIEGFVDALQERLGPLAEQWLAEEGLPLRQSLRNWVDANPVMVVITALLAAAGAVLADLDIPTLEKEFDLGKGFTGSLSADLGSLRNIALEQVKASLEYASGPLMAAINVNVEGDDVSGDASVRYEGDRWSGGLAANVDKDGVVGGSADVGYSHDGLSANGRATFADSKFSGYSLNATRESGKLTDRFALSGTGDGGWDGSLGRTYTGDRWSAGLSADAANDRRLGGTASLGYSHDGLSADARASFTDGDFSGYALNANRQDGKFSERFSLSGNGDGDWSATHGRSYTGDRWSGSLQNGIGPDGAWNTSASTAYQGDRLSAGLKGTLDHTGAATGEGSLGYNREDLSLSALGRFDQDGLDSYQFDSSIGPDNRQLGFGLSGTGAGDWKASASGSYSTEDVKTELEGWLRSDGGVGGSAKIDWTSGEWSAGGETSFEIGNDRVLDVGLYAGFRSRDEFRTWMGRYAYASEHDRHTFSLLAEEKLGNIYTRLEHSTVMGATGEQYNTSLHGAYFLDNSQKTAIIGGLRHRRDFDGSHNYTPEVGMQLDRNALTLGYDIEQEAVMLNFVMPFGRK